MTLQYTLNENDFLQHQLYVASKNKRIKQQRKRTWLIYSGSFLLLSLMFYQSDNKFLTYYFLIFGLLFLCFFPFYQKWHYKNHYKKFINENYKNRFGQAENISLTEDCIETKDITSESKLNLTAIENITETSDYFYIKMKAGGHLIIPKSGVESVDGLRDKLKRFANKLSIDFILNLNWRQN